MRTRHAQHPFVAQQRIRQPLRAGGIGQVAIENLLHQRIAARHHVADHEHIRLEFELLNTEAFDEFDALCLKLRTHRRIDVGVAAGDAIAGLFGDGGDAAHESAADAEDVDVFLFAHHQFQISSFRRRPESSAVI